MPYKVYKITDDNRNSTCGLVIPNGGWYHIMDMTFENYQQLVNLSARPGYSVDRVEGVPGMYDPEGNQVDPGTVEIDRTSKEVAFYKRVTEKRGTKQVPVKSKKVETGEREAIVNECLKRGMRIDMRWSTKTLKDLIAKADSKPVEKFGSLAIASDNA